MDELNRSYEFLKFLSNLKTDLIKVFWKNSLRRGPWVWTELTFANLPSRHYSPVSLTFHKTPDLLSLSPAVLPLTETVTAGKKRAARLTGGEGGPAKGGVGSGRLWRSRRGTA